MNRRKTVTFWKKILLRLLLAGVVSYALLFTAMLAGARDEVQGEPQVMIILGCQVMEWGPSILLQDRLNRALEYLQDYPGMPVVVSGGQGSNEPMSEARAMADYLEAHGISRETIILEDQSRNTKENLIYSASLLLQNGSDPAETEVLVVSNGFHLTRARILAERAGFDTVSTLAAPANHLSSRIHMHLREPLALLKSFVFDHGRAETG